MPARMSTSGRHDRGGRCPGTGNGTGYTDHECRAIRARDGLEDEGGVGGWGWWVDAEGFEGLVWVLTVD
jgi:hypothetical protein